MLVTDVSKEVRRGMIESKQKSTSELQHYSCTRACVLVPVHVTCIIAVSSVTTVSWCGGGGGEVRTTPVSLTTGSEVASETAVVAHSIC